jgi:acyl-CoA reductase-like NAD-dependent aldehyde dehydrogenase
MAAITDHDTMLPIVPLWIDGRPVTSTEAGFFPVFSAAQKKEVYRAQNADPKLAVAAAEASERAFKQWKCTSAASRRDIIIRMNGLIEARKKELVAVQMEETSCSQSWAEFNIGYTTLTLAEIAARVTTACAGELPAMSTRGPMGFVFKEAIGPVLLIAP